MRTLFAVVLTVLIAVVPIAAQNVGDHYTAGYTNSRTYLNSDMGEFGPPLSLVDSIALTGVDNASSLIVFESGGLRHLLVGEETASSIEYQLFDAEQGTAEWGLPVSLLGRPAAFHYQPAYANDMVILGGATTTTAKAVQVSTGAELWEDRLLGDSNGRFPVLTNGLVLYHGSKGLVGANPVLGRADSFFQISVTTAQAPLSIAGQQGYFLDDLGTLRAFNTADGSQVWTFAGLSAVNPNYIAAEKYVFINTASGAFGAIGAADGAAVWGGTSPALSETPPMALAYDRLYLFVTDRGDETSALESYNPDTGELLWSVSEDGTGLEFGTVANGVVYYYNQTSQALRARNAFTGNLIWDHPLVGVRGLSLAEDRLYVLLADRVDIFAAEPLLFFTHLADGGGLRTLLTLTSVAPDPVNGTVEFLATDGSPLSLDVADAGLTSSVDFAVPPGGSATIQTLGGTEVQSGWARVRADGALTGSSIFQFLQEDGIILNEAGVADSRMTGRASVYIEVHLPPSAVLPVDSGVAVANPNGRAAEVEFILLSRAGNEIDSTVITLEPGYQIALFVTQLFPDLIPEDFSGTLRIQSEVPVVIAALRTQAGLQLSSYPVAQ